MATALFHDVIFGPIQSRRLGLSLGVNLLPLSNKLCSFDCIYCECGWAVKGQKPRFNSRQDVKRLLKEKLEEMAKKGKMPDVITFAGNGEPTLHPDFEEIINDTIKLRNDISPKSKISVLSNATMINRESVRNALNRVDNNILKLDSAFDETVRTIDKPNGTYSVAETVELMKLFNGEMIIQTMFLRGVNESQTIDNTTKKEVDAWLKLVAEVAPKSVMIYTIDRDTPAQGLTKVSIDDLKLIAAQVEELGITCSVAG